MNRRLFAGLALVSLLFATGCGHLDLTPAGDPNRAITGTVKINRSVPPGAELVVRLLDTAVATRARAMDVPVADLAKPQAAERVVGEFVQTLPHGATDAVPFRIEFQAEDAVLRRGLNLEARISVGGRVRFRTLTAHVVTLASSPYPHELLVEPIDR